MKAFPYILIISILQIIITDVSAQMTPTYVVNIPMRDSKTLAADVYVPASCNSCPTILIQTPYNKNLFRNGLPLGTQQNLQSSPYSWVVVDWRGFYGSAAAAIQQPQRGQDGYDVIDWIVSQTWSNGLVGTWGPSALGVIQYQTAKENHPNHTCAVPMVAHPQTSYENYFYGGILEKSYLQTLDALGYGLSTLVMANTYYNNVWQFAENNTWYPSSINIPTLQIGGWYDHNIDKMVDWYADTRASAGAAVRDSQWLLVGPWVHGGTGSAYVGSAQQGELSYPDAAFKTDSMARDFFAYYLLRANNNWEATPKITFYELGNNQWNITNNASVEINNTNELFLQEGNMLGTYSGTGSSAFISDPRNPSPTIGGQTLSPQLDQGPYDQTSLESRQDVITFSTDDLLSDVSISGRVKANLYIECNQPDADIAVRMVDEYPDGRNMLINDGIRRMRFRNGYTQANESFMTLGQIYNVEITLPFTNYTWKAGHQIKIYISGNSSARWDVNLQNGTTMYAAGDTNIADITIHHTSQYPSKVLLPGNNIFTSIANKEFAKPFAVYPNPVSGTLHFQHQQIGEAIIYNPTGEAIFKKHLTKNETQIATHTLAPGIYILQLSDRNKVYRQRFVKE
jgi:predicted acyl esterase